MEQAVAPGPEITMIIKGQKVWALLDMGVELLVNKPLLNGTGTCCRSFK